MKPPRAVLLRLARQAAILAGALAYASLVWTPAEANTIQVSAGFGFAEVGGLSCPFGGGDPTGGGGCDGQGVFVPTGTTATGISGQLSDQSHLFTTGANAFYRASADLTGLMKLEGTASGPLEGQVSTQLNDFLNTGDPLNPGVFYSVTGHLRLTGFIALDHSEDFTPTGASVSAAGFSLSMFGTDSTGSFVSCGGTSSAIPIDTLFDITLSLPCATTGFLSYDAFVLVGNARNAFVGLGDTSVVTVDLPPGVEFTHSEFGSNAFLNGQFPSESVPEPATLVLLLTGLVGLGGGAWRRFRQ